VRAHVRRAFLIAILLEGLVVSVNLMGGETIARQAPWIEALQTPALIVLWPFQYPGFRLFAGKFPAMVVVRAAQIIGFLIQTVVFSAAILLLTGIYARYKRRASRA
jgi:hypothetical protein